MARDTRSIHASQDALDFLSSLGDDIIPQLLFSETVHERIDGKDSLCLKVDVALGGSSDGSNFYSITVTRTTLSGESEDVIQMITAVVSPSLQVLEEKYSSKSTEGNKTQIILSLNEDRYQLTRTEHVGQESYVSGRSIAVSDMKGFVSEGSSFLLQRLLALQQCSFPLSLKFIGLDYDNTDLCTVVYQDITESKESQSSRCLRKQYDKGAKPSIVWESVLDDGGHLKLYELVTTVPVADEKETSSSDTDTVLEQPSGSRQKPAEMSITDVMSLPGSLQWEDDMEMFSHFLDRKEDLKESHARYMKQHPELKAILADFLQFLLLRKPSDVSSFAADFFSSYSAQAPPSGGFAASSGRTS